MPIGLQIQVDIISPSWLGIELIENPNSANGKGVINGKAGKAVALPKFSDTLILSEPGEADYAYLITPLPEKLIVQEYIYTLPIL